MFGLDKLADRDFVVAYVMPVLIGCCAVAFLFRETGQAHAIYQAILEERSFTSLTLLVLAVWGIAILLMTWNHALYRALEGYWGPLKRDNWVEEWKDQFDDELNVLEKQKEAIETLPEGRDRDAEMGTYIKALIARREKYPYRRDLILPTRFGNVLKAFETYSLDIYGIDSIPAWSRIIAMVPDSFAAQISGARATVSFFVNLWAICLLVSSIAFAKLIAACVWESIRTGWQTPASALEPTIALLVALGLSYPCYEWAVSSAIAWGDLVKSTFDLYLPALAKQLGYQLPSSAARRREFWGEITSTFLALEAIQPEKWPAADGKLTPVGKRPARQSKRSRS